MKRKFIVLAILSAMTLLLLANIDTDTNTVAAPTFININQTPNLLQRKISGSSGSSLSLGEIYNSGHSRPHAELCPDLGAGLQVLVITTSAPEHALARLAIRYTWGHFAARSDVAVAFLIGEPPQQLLQSIDAEDKLYGDLIIGNFVDSYSNLTLKTLSMLEWVNTYCPRVPRVLKTDDDMFINIPRLLNFTKARENATNIIWGMVMKNNRVQRSPKAKYRVSYKQYPNKMFPDFTSGPAYLLSTDVVAPLLREASTHPIFPLEDVFFTGILGELLNISRVHANDFYNKKLKNTCAIPHYISVHKVKPRDQFQLWFNLLGRSGKCR